ncbi:6-phosphogluconate dehydrogenase 2 [Cordyceps militaris CM01]|uniref:Protein ARV n=1 Tax=Cordyceps militaris (strain CM01) TaxID=983644 RepID=G3JCR1_CORMM|nr:6-phosphogluconate dehydrogenase 2 [Cordyceps militaris CM01]EGX94669.1 6-phosphogluconate dehydrogenase 2 [Cordyceps militaris CM01]
MPICIECRHPVKTLWTQYSGAGDKASGHNIRLTVCRKCGRFCDKYVEHDFVVLFIDLVLIKPQPSIVRLGILLLLFDVYLTWARIENQGLPGETPGERNESSLGQLAQQPIVIQYFFFLMLCTLSTLAFHAVIRFLVASSLSPLVALGVLPRYRRPNSVSTALLVSSSTKLFPILLVIWDYDVPAAATSLGWAVVANNVEALRILLDCRYYVACLLALIGAATRWSVARLVLVAVGLNGTDSMSVDASMATDAKALWGAVTLHQAKSRSTMAPTLLWIGLGNMGRAMCKNIVDKGNLDAPLLIYNRSKQRAVDLSQKLPGGKTEVVESLVDAVAKVDIIFTCVANDEAVSEVIAAALQADIKGKLFIECSTIHPDATQATADKLLAQGAEFVAAPVFGAPAAAEAGQLIAVLAGPSASVDRARPWFKGVTARAEIDLTGAPYGKATTLKVIGNTFVLNMVEQLAEAHVLAETSGLGTQPIHALVEALFPGPYAAYSTRMLSGDYHTRAEPLWAVDLARKDARHAKALAAAAGTRVQNVETADAHLASLREHAGPSGDIAAIYGVVRKKAGLNFKNDV